MLPMSGNMVNMNGSDDPSYRYVMPALIVKHEGASKMKKTVIVNLSEVSQAVGRPVEYLLTYLGQSLSAASKVEKVGGKAYIAGHHDPKLIQQQILTFIQEFVMCKCCRNPETSCKLEGSNKKKLLFLTCKSCGGRSDLDSTDKFVKHMAQHLPQDFVESHMKIGRGTTATMVIVSQLADTAQVEDERETKKEKRTCPNPCCGKRSSKFVCSKCGTSMTGVAEMPDDQGCHVLVQQWMQNHKDDHVSAELLEDFEAIIKSSDFRTSPADQLATVIQVVAAEVSTECNLSSEKLQPMMVSKKAFPLVKNWSALINDLCLKCGGNHVGMDVIIFAAGQAVGGLFSTEDTREPIVIGFLLCLRDHVDAITDDDILSGCKKLPSCGMAMQKFIQFLEEDSDDENDAE